MQWFKFNILNAHVQLTISGKSISMNWQYNAPVHNYGQCTWKEYIHELAVQCSMYITISMYLERVYPRTGSTMLLYITISMYLKRAYPERAVQCSCT